jgi:hypothetical protein
VGQAKMEGVDLLSHLRFQASEAFLKKVFNSEQGFALLG